MQQGTKEAKGQNVSTSVRKGINGQDVSKMRVMRSLPASLKVKQCAKSLNSECALVTFFRWMGLLYESENHVLFGAFSFLFILPNINGLVTIYILWNSPRLKLSILHLSTYFLSNLIWYSMRKKRKCLSDLLRSISMSQESLVSMQFQRVSFCLTCSVPFISVTTEALKEATSKITKSYSLYGIEVSFFVKVVFKYLMSISHVFIYPTFANLASLLYCSLCLHAGKKLRLIIDDIENCPAKEFTVPRQRDILRHKTEIGTLLRLIQNIFSVPSFLVSTAYFCSCIAILGTFIVDKDVYTEHYVVLTQLFVIFLCSSGGLLASLWIAGGLPLEEDRLKEAFRKKMKQRLHLVVNSKNERYIQSQIVESPSFVLSGCDIIYFQRSSILSLAGTVLTYTVLLISKN